MGDTTHAMRTVTAEDFTRAAFWRDFAPALHLDTLDPGQFTTPQQALERLTRRIMRDGYFGDVDPRLATLAPTIGEAVKTLVRFGLPPVLVWVYDEPWECFRRLAPVIGSILGEDYKLLPAFWAWHVDPSKGEAGWQPHRDKTTGSLAPDGSPLSLTCWIPLSEATPLNGCMYVVPAYLDPSYNRPVSEQRMPAAPLARALPAKPGDFLIWNQAILHWGSMSSEFGDKPRMSMALEFQRGDIAPFQQPLLESKALPSFGDRIRLIARQILQYTHMYGVPEKHVQLAQFLINAPVI